MNTNNHYLYKSQSLFARSIEKIGKNESHYRFVIRFAIHKKKPYRDQRWWWFEEAYLK